ACPREDGPLAGRRVSAQAAHDEPHVADRAARRDALAPRLPARVCRDAHLAPAAALLHPGAARARAGAQRARPARRRRSAVLGHARPAAGAAAGRPAGRRAALAPASDRPLLRAHDRLARGGPVGLAAPWHARLVGRRRGHALRGTMLRRSIDILVSAAALLVCAPPLALAMLAIRLESR